MHISILIVETFTYYHIIESLKDAKFREWECRSTVFFQGYIWFINHNFDYLIITQDFKQKYENKLHFCPLALWVVLAITVVSGARNIKLILP